MRGGAYINVYQLVDKDGNEVMRGTAPELAEKLKCSVVTVTNAARPVKGDPHSNFWLRRKYKVIKVGEKPRKKTYGNRIKAKPKVEEKDPTGLEYLKLMLVYRRYDQTVCMFDPFPYLPDLYDMGVNCTAKEVNDCDVMMRLKPVGRRRKQKTHYFVEVKERWITRPSPTI